MRVLLLAGTWEARQIAAGLTREPRIRAVASLAHAERTPKALGIPTRIGGFGGDDAFADYLKSEGIDAIVDATHPFAVQVSRRTQAAAEILGVDYIQFLRPSWIPDAGDDWTFVNAECEAFKHIPDGSRVFLATGRRSLSDFGNMEGRRLFVRLVAQSADPFPFKNGEYVTGIPPFSVESEIGTFERLNIDWLVARNSGGINSRAKLDAARFLGIKVAMIRRPPQPPGPKVDTVAEALAWVRRRM